MNNKLILMVAMMLLMVSSVSAAAVSLDKIDVGSNYGRLNGEYIVADWRATPQSTDNIRAILDTSDMDDLEDDGKSYLARYDIEITADNTESFAYYGFDLGTHPVDISTVSFYRHEIDCPSFDSSQECLDRGLNYINQNRNLFLKDTNGQPIAWSQNFGLYTFENTVVYGLIIDDKLGSIADVETGDNKFSTDWSIKGKNGAEQQSGTITNTGSSVSRWFGDEVYIEYTGGMSFGVNAPETEGIYAMYNMIGAGKQWKIVGQRGYDQYLTTIDNIADDLRNSDVGTSDNELRNYFEDSRNNVNYRAHRVSDTNPPSEWTTSDADVQSINLESGSDISSQSKLIVSFSNTEVFFPTFRIFIDADYAGLYISTGEPRILDVRGTTFDEGQSSTIQVDVKNVGSARGGFTLSGSCPNFDIGTKTFNLGAQQEDTVSLPIDGKSQSGDSGTISESCTITLTEEKTHETDSETVNINMRVESECNEGSWKCGVYNGLPVAQECSGGLWQNIEQCTEEEVCTNGDDGTKTCEIEDNGGIGDPTDPDKEGSFNMVLFAVAAGLGLLTTLVVLVYSKPLSINKWLNVLRWVLSIAAGILVFVCVALLYHAVVDLFSFGGGGLIG